MSCPGLSHLLGQLLLVCELCQCDLLTSSDSCASCATVCEQLLQSDMSVQFAECRITGSGAVLQCSIFLALLTILISSQCIIGIVPLCVGF